MADRSNRSRRAFVKTTGAGALALISQRFLFAAPFTSARKLRVGIVGGRFGLSFYFNEHPNCIVEAVSDLREDRRARLMETYQCNTSYPSLTELLKNKKVEAVFLATPAPDHVRHTIECLKAGKHVLCAVPAALTLEECDALKKAVEQSGLKYMMAETSVYRQGAITARKFYREGTFGSIFSAASEYNHPGLEKYFFEEGKQTWRHGFPPMLYPTHCTSFLISVTGARLTHVTAAGWGDRHELLKNNPYNNPFWNETAFFKTNQNIPFRVEVNWKGALVEAERAEWRGDQMSFFYPDGRSKQFMVVRSEEIQGRDDAGFAHTKNIVEPCNVPKWWQTDMLPERMRHDSGHEGSHTFITHEFLSAILEDRQPEINVYEAIAYTAPGIVAHQSALKDGEYMAIPNFDR
ncbi:MAG: Gfo/Idh/MocA family oxidoreductase [Chitinophagaceae bacterium]|nr:Gfo/Idh/MocA family oxidoreductase [Chitinophagaceae bacterium]MCW5926673.1 Gfo/Idh/MocA family oxidoreductase [Chitinophagaceae bacterium]